MKKTSWPTQNAPITPVRNKKQALLMILLACAVSSCTQSTDSRLALPRFDNAPEVAFQNVSQDTDYAGDAACASCHEDLYTSYQSHGMARSYYALTPDSRIEPLTSTPIHHEATGFYYTVGENDEGLFQEEFLLSEDGEKIHSLTRPMDFVMGSGSAARTYITEHEGRLYQLPLTWYTQASTWDFSPGYKEKNGRFDRLIPDRCMACHNGYSETIPFEEGKFAQVPEGIGCERCHGPGARHIEERYAIPEPADSIDTSIVNPAHLSFTKRLDVCQQCHFSAPSMLLREHREAFDFKPSESLEEHLAVFVEPNEKENGAIDVVSHADRMRMSACFLGTLNRPKPLECTTCHNPHEGFRDQGPAYFNQTCMNCHTPEALQGSFDTPEAQANHAPDAQCFGCHMPKVQAEDAPHSSFTDHYIQIQGKPPAQQTTPASTDPLVPYFDKDKRNRTGQGYLGMALVIQGSQSGDLFQVAQGASTLDVALQSDTTLGNGYFLQGVAHQTLGDLDKAVPAFERAVRLAPGNPERILALALAYEQAGRPAAVIERLYRLALQSHPAFSELRLRYGQFLLSQGRVQEAGTALEATVTDNPWLAEAVLLNGLIQLAMDEPRAALQSWQTALALSPDYAAPLSQVFVLDQGELSRVDLFAHPLLEKSRQEATVSLKAVGNALDLSTALQNATLSIFAPNGTRIHSIEPNSGPIWNLQTPEGTPLPTGVYLIQVRSQGEQSRTELTRFMYVDRGN